MLRKDGIDVLAAAILLDSTLTFATLFGVAFDPVCRLAIIATLLQPHPCDSTQYGSMVAIDGATKAKLVLWVRPTGHRWDDGRQCGT